MLPLLRVILCDDSRNFFQRCSTFVNEKPLGEAVFLSIVTVRIQVQSRLSLSRPPISVLGRNAIKLVPL